MNTHTNNKQTKLPYFQTPKLSPSGIFFLCFFLCSFFSYGQEYQWQWAKSGGGELGFSGGITDSFRDECVIDIAVDNNNNYYYLININGSSPMYNDIALEHYGGKDILLLSTDEDGNYRWHQVIGGRNNDFAYSMVVDSENGVYINAVLVTNAIEGDHHSYTHLSSDVTLPKIPQNWNYSIPHPAFRYGYLLKYSKEDGTLLSYKNYQDETVIKPFSISRLWIDSNDIIHTYVVLLAGTHLEGMVTVEEGNIETYLVQLDTSLNIVGTPRLLPLKGTSHNNNFFVYNEELNTYYIGGLNIGVPISYNNVEIEGEAFILAINGETLEEEWRKVFNYAELSNATSQTSILIDDESNIYLPGRYTYSSSFNPRYFGDYALPENIEGGNFLAHVPFVIKLNAAGEVLWVRVPDSFTNQFSRQKQNENESVALINGEVIIVPRNPASTWGDFEINSPQNPNTVPAIVRLNPETGEVLGTTYIDNFGAFTKVVGDKNGNIVLGGSFFYQMFSDNEEIPTLQAISSRTDFFMTKLVLDTASSTDNVLQANTKVYPNPTTDIVYFETEEHLQTYELYNMLGQRVKQGSFDNSLQINLSSFTSGTYFIKVITKTGDAGVFKVVKE